MGNVRVIARAENDRLGEGLWWSARDQAVYWVDIHGAKLHRLTLGTEAVTTWAMPAKIGWAIERERDPGFVIGLATGIATLSLDPFEIFPLAVPDPFPPGRRLNDATTDSAGRIWLGTMADDAVDPVGALFRLDADHCLTLVDAPYVVPNGPAFSLDGGTMYHTDSRRRVIFRFDLEGGEISDRAVHIEFPESWGVPDGMTVDADDHLWVCHYGGGRVSRFDPAGRLHRSLTLPTSRITNCVFAGDDLDRMFVTSARHPDDPDPLAGGLFEIAPSARGVPLKPFAG